MAVNGGSARSWIPDSQEVGRLNNTGKPEHPCDTEKSGKEANACLGLGEETPGPAESPLLIMSGQKSNMQPKIHTC